MLQEIGEKVKPISKYAAKATLPAGLVLASVWGEVRQGNAELELGQIANQDFSHSLFLDQKSAVDQAIENLGLNIPSLAELQQNPAERYFIQTSFIDTRLAGNPNVFLGVTNLGTGPGCPDGPVPRVDVYIDFDRNLTMEDFNFSFNLDPSKYNICNVGISSISVVPNGLISMGVGEQIAGTFDIYPRGGTAVNYYDNPRDFTKHIRLPDAGISHILMQTGGRLDLTFNDISPQHYRLELRNAVDPRNDGSRYLRATSSLGQPLDTSWSESLSTPTTASTPTRTATINPTVTSTARPTYTSESTRTPIPTTSAGNGVRGAALTEGLVFSWENMPNTATTALLRLRGDRFEHIATLPATTTSHRDSTVFNPGELVCYISLSISSAGENLGLSPFLCKIEKTRVGTLPSGVRIAVGGMTRFSYNPNSLVRHAVFEAVPSQRLIPETPGANSIGYDTKTPLSVALLLALTETGVAGHSDIFLTVSF